MTDRRWQTTYHFDPALARLFDGHYSRRTVGAPQFRPPGQGIQLYIPAAFA